MQPQHPQAKPTAHKIKIIEILQSQFIKGDDQSANYLLTSSEEKIFRVNVIAAITSKEEVGTIQNIYLEDGTGKIIARLFEELKNKNPVQIGEIVLCIGRVREFNGEKYISPEIIKTTNALWLKVREREKRKERDEKPVTLNISPERNEEDTNSLPAQKIVSLIKKLDRGDGAYIEEVISQSLLKGVEEIIERMLKKGEIFQNAPGKIKIL